MAPNKGVIFVIQFREDSYAYNFLKIMALCGEFPYHSLYLLNGNDRIIKRTILNMKKEGYITILGKGQMKNIRLTKKVFPILEKMGEEYFSHYMDMTDEHHFRGGKDKNAERIVWRRHRMAEIFCMLMDAGIFIWTHEKPILSLQKKEFKKTDDCLFYSSRELKNADKRQRYKTDFTRIMGALFSPGGIYCIYNINRGRIKWNRQGEGKAKVLVQDIASLNYTGKYIEANRAILFGKDLNTIIEILNSSGGFRDANDFEILSFDNTYPNIHFITLDSNGLYQLNLLIQENWYDAICYSIFPEEFINDKKQIYTVDCDAYDQINRKYIMMFFDGNIGKLKRFKEASYDNKYKYEVVCFDWQKEMVSQYVKENCSIVSISSEKLSEMIENTFS